MDILPGLAAFDEADNEWGDMNCSNPEGHFLCPWSPPLYLAPLGPATFLAVASIQFFFQAYGDKGQTLTCKAIREAFVIFLKWFFHYSFVRNPLVAVSYVFYLLFAILAAVEKSPVALYVMVFALLAFLVFGFGAICVALAHHRGLHCFTDEDDEVPTEVRVEHRASTSSDDKFEDDDMDDVPLVQ